MKLGFCFLVSMSMFTCVFIFDLNSQERLCQSPPNLVKWTCLVTITAGLEAKKIHHNIRLAVHKMTMTLETICRIARKQILVGSTTNDDSFWYTQVSVSVSIQLWHIYRAPKRTCFRELWKSMFLVVSIWCNKGGGCYYDNDCVGDDHAAHLL